MRGSAWRQCLATGTLLELLPISLRLYGVVEFGKALGLKNVYRGLDGDMPELTQADRTRLLVEFEPDMQYLESLLDRDLSAWRNPV